MLAVMGLLYGLGVGYVAGGRLFPLPDVQPRWPTILLVLFLLQGQVRGRLVGDGVATAGVAIWALVAVSIAWALFARLSAKGAAWYPARGMGAIAVGMSLNVLVVLLNGGMPIGRIPSVEASMADFGGFYLIVNEGTIAPWLGDVMDLSLLRTQTLVSVGDVLLVLGVAVLVVEWMLRNNALHNGDIAGLHEPES